MKWAKKIGEIFSNIRKALSSSGTNIHGIVDDRVEASEGNNECKLPTQADSLDEMPNIYCSYMGAVEEDSSI